MEQSITYENENAERILEAGWELFRKKGYRGVSVDEVCQRCNLTKPTLYYYFQNKENLYVQVLLQRLSGFRKAIEIKGDFATRLKSFVRHILDSSTPDQLFLVRDMENIRNTGYHRQVMEAFQSEIITPLAGLMQDGIDAGELSKGDPAFYAWVLLGIVGPFIAHPRPLQMRSRVSPARIVRFFLSGAQDCQSERNDNR